MIIAQYKVNEKITQKEDIVMNALSIFNRMRNPKYYSVRAPQRGQYYQHGDSYESIANQRSLFAPFLSFFDDSYRMLKEKDGQYTVSFDVPGVSKEDLTIEIDNNVLVIATVSQETEEQSKDKKAAREYHFHIPVPENVDHENITANMENGVLTIQLPISEAAVSKKIAIQ